VHRAADDCSFQSANGSEASGGCRPIGNEADELVAKKVLERSLSGMTEIALRQQGICPPFPFPPRASRGGWVPPTPGGTLRAKKERLARIDAAGSPPRGLPPPWRSPASALARGLDRSGTTACLRKRPKSADAGGSVTPKLETALVAKKEKPPRRLDLPVPSHGSMHGKFGILGNVESVTYRSVKGV
jgi:hypothetical protein